MALVIGGASGIGWAVARGLAAQGCRVTIADLNADGAGKRADELGAPYVGVGVDVTDEDSVAELFERVAPLDIVVNTAGIGGVGRITELPVEQFRSVVDVCLVGGFIVAKYAGRHLRDGGSLVSLTSLNARLAAPGMSSYCAAKAGLVMLTQVAALELAPRGIRVNAVSPGFVDTPLTEGVKLVPGDAGGVRREHSARPGRYARRRRRRGAVPGLRQSLLDDRRSARPQRRRAPETLSRCVGTRGEDDVGNVTYFSGKQAIVTGAGSGIGAALSRALVAAGADVLCTDIDADAAEAHRQRGSRPG